MKKQSTDTKSSGDKTMKMHREFIKCDWPGCSKKTKHPRTNGWSSFVDTDRLVAGQDADLYFLCPVHTWFQALDEQSQRTTKQAAE
jgi:hypothetical protein